MNNNFDYEGAKAAGYSDQEIKSFLLKSEPKPPVYEKKQEGEGFFEPIARNARNFWNNLGSPTGEEPEKKVQELDLIDQRLLKKTPFDVQGAIDSGYTAEEINAHLQENQPKRSGLAKAGRLGAQYGIAALQGSPLGLAYEAGVAPLASKSTQNQIYRESLGEDLESLMEKKATGHWDENDQEMYDHISKQILDPNESKKYAKTLNAGIRDIAEDLSGVDLHPEDISEKAAEWLGFLRNPTKFVSVAKDISKTGLTPKKLTDLMGGTDILRSFGAGTALQIAEDGNFGPMGTMGAAIVGDLAGGGVGAIIKGINNVVSGNTKKSLSNLVAKFTPQDKVEIQKDLIKSLRKNGIQANLGTVTDNKLIQAAEARLQQSALSGESPEKLKKAIESQIKADYERVGKSLADAKFQTLNEAGEYGKASLKAIRDIEKTRIGQMYEKARSRLNDKSVVDSSRLSATIQNIEKSLKPGKLKSTEQKAVLNVLKDIKNDLINPNTNTLRPIPIQNLMNTKTALNDIINYEVQGGQKQLLKQLVGEIDRAIISHGKVNPKFAKEYIAANQEFSQHAKTFRNPNIDKILRADDPMILMNKMDSVQGIRDIRNALLKAPDGKPRFNDLARTKLDQLIGNKMSDNVSEQLKTGKFANILQNPKTDQLVKELLPKHAYDRLKSLMKNSGKIAQAAQKFFNASKSGVTVVDSALIGKVLFDVGALFSGNPWPFAQSAAAGLTANSITKLIYDPEFIKLVEDAILATQQNNMGAMITVGKMIEEKVIPLIKNSYLSEENQGNQSQ